MTIDRKAVKVSRKLALNLDYAFIQGTYWMFYAVAGMFVSVYMLGKGYSNTAIGVVIAVGNIIAVFAQSIIANMTDRSEKINNITVIKVLIVIMFVLTCGLLVIGKKSVALTAVYTVLIVAHTTLHPFANALSFMLEESGEHVSFGFGRSMGSFTAAVMGLAMGYLVAGFGVDAIPFSGIIMLILMEIAIIITGRHYAQICREKKAERPGAGESGEDRKVNNCGQNDKRLGTGNCGMRTEAEQCEEASVSCEALSGDERKDNVRNDDASVSFSEFIRNNTGFMILSVGIVGLFFGNVILENFTIQIVKDVGGDTEQLGIAIFVMAILEMPAMLSFDKLKERFSYCLLIRVASVFFTLKIVMMYLAQSLTFIYIAQVNQILGYGLMFPAIVSFIDHIMSKGEAVRGQAVFTAAITIGNVLGCVCGGRILDVASVKTLLLISSVISLVGSVIIFVMVKNIHQKS